MCDNRSLILNNIVTEIGNKVYDDLGHPTLKELGSIGEGIMKFVALPFKFLGLTATQLEERYKSFIIKTINKVSEENQIPPQSVIVSPILEQVKYIFDDKNSELEDMFSDLLASAIDKNSENKVHPIFVNILKQLNPTDAKILNTFFPFERSIKELTIESNIAYIASKEEIADGEYYYEKQLALHVLPCNDTITKYHTSDIMLSLDVLKNLGLINIIEDYNKKENEEEFNEYFEALLKPYWDNLISIDKIELTLFGENFLKLCNRRYFI